jgi:hypothetical protein
MGGLLGMVGQDKNLAYNPNLEMGIQTVVQHHQLRSCRKFQQKNSKAWELSNPSHPPCFAQVLPNVVVISPWPYKKNYLNLD